MRRYLINGKQHTKITLVLSGTLLIVPLINKDMIQLGLPLGCALGTIITPDLDVNNGSISNHWIRKNLGAMFEAMWRIFWYPYSQAIPHRSKLSHLPVLGTLLRIAYIVMAFGIIIIPLMYYNETIPMAYIRGVYAIAELKLFWYAIIGLGISDIAHWIADYV